jgi:hypothetical protein
MEEILTGDVWKEVNSRIPKRVKKFACIAYVTLDNLNLTKGDTLICNASDYAIKNGQTDAKVLAKYFKKGVEIYSCQNLHSKLLLAGKNLVIGSANMSLSSANNLIETAVLTQSETLIAQAQAFCENLLEPEESNKLTKDDISCLLKIKVVRRGIQPTTITKSKTRNIKFGQAIWIISVSPLSERIASNEQGFTDQVELELNNDNLNYIRFTGNSDFRNNAKEGDRIFIIWKNHNGTRSYLYPMNTILKKQENSNWTRFYYDDSKTSKNKIPFSKFLKDMESLSLDKKISKFSTRILSKSDTEKLKKYLSKYNFKYR